MPLADSSIITQLRQDILQMQGFKPALHAADVDPGLGPVRYAFPNATFPLGAVHELVYDGMENAAATVGFTAGILTALMRKGAVCVWVSSTRNIFPPALASYGIVPEKVIFIQLQKEKDLLWTIEEALRCEGLAAVVGETRELSFTASRRLQLAVEQSRVTGFILRQDPKKLNTTASVCRWKISSLPSIEEEDLPGIGFPCWDVQLLKVRNGHPGNWQLMWANGKFSPVYPQTALIREQHKKTG